MGSAGWWDLPWNPVGGCSPASTGCRFCYAALEAGTRQAATGIALYEGTTDWVRGRPVFNNHLTVWHDDHPGWGWPLDWKGAARPLLGPGQPSLIFVGMMTDLFHEDRPTEHIDRVVKTITHSRHIGLLLTKRPDVMSRYFAIERPPRWRRKLWLGCSIERQQEADDAVASHAYAFAAAGWTVFLSCAPLLGPIVLPDEFLQHGKRVWCIASGEQDSGRWLNPDWPRALLAQCRGAGVPYYLLQMSQGREIPDDLRVREFPWPRP